MIYYRIGINFGLDHKIYVLKAKNRTCRTRIKVECVPYDIMTKEVQYFIKITAWKVSFNKLNIGTFLQKLDFPYFVLCIFLKDYTSYIFNLKQPMTSIKTNLSNILNYVVAHFSCSLPDNL